MIAIARVARHELRLLWRDRVALIALALVAILSAVSAAVAWERVRSAEQTQMRLQSRVDREFDAQPNRHPHRMVHYGHFAFRPLDALAAFDPGIDAFAGTIVYLEGHRQNSANFADVRQSSLLLRFGQLTPAFILQILLPLLLIVLGFGIVARDRERGSLRLLLSQGVRSLSLLTGKSLALLIAGVIATAPALLALAMHVTTSPLGPWAAMFAGYGIYLILWTLAVVLVSTSAGSSGASLRFLLGTWAVLVVMVPRLAPELAMLRAPAATRFETELIAQRELRAIGDSHDENDPYFEAFKRQVLERHGVTRVADLPVNYNGLLALEGERMTSELFDRHSRRLFDTQQMQAVILDGFALLSPLPAIRRLSMAAAQTDLQGYRRFIEQAEQYRYEFVQQLNRLQAEAVTYADDTGRDEDPAREKRTRIDSAHWREIPDFRYIAAPPGEIVARTLPAFGALLAWSVALAVALAIAWRRVARNGL